MSYSDNENSLDSGTPIEVYKITTPSRVYRYAAAFEAVSVNGERYQPAVGGITRNDMDVGTLISSLTTVDITFSIETQLAKDVSFDKSPDFLFIQILRTHRNDNSDVEWQQVYAGDALQYVTAENRLTIRTGSSLQALMQEGNNTVYYQRPCNHVLYDSRCRVDRIANTHTTTVVEIGVDAVKVASTGFPDGELEAGIITILRTGETRFMLSNVVDTIDIDAPFNDIIIGDEVSVARGCNRSRERCTTGFNNGSNFGGFLHIPKQNPFKG